VGLGCSRCSSLGSRGGGMRFPRTGSALVQAGQYYVASRGRRKRDRGIKNRRSQRSQDDRRIHLRHTQAAE
jgi:hypothetical protein